MIIVENGQRQRHALDDASREIDEPTESMPEIAARILRSANYCSFIKKHHDFYLHAMEYGLKTLREQTDECKRLMDVTDDELQQFGHTE